MLPMQFVQTLFSFLLALGILITFHELGHYWLARRFDVKVLRFSIGFGPAIKLWRRGADATEWVIAAIPLGGYVKMLDEREAPVADSELHRAFNRKPAWQRAIIVLGGPLANLLLAVALFWLVFMGGGQDIRAQLGDIPLQTPVAAAGFHAGDEIVSVNGIDVTGWQEFRLQVLQQSLEGRSLLLTVRGTQYGMIQKTLDLPPTVDKDIDVDLMQKLGFTPVVHLPEVGFIDKSGAGARAGLLQNDRITHIDQQPVRHWSDVVVAVRSHPNLALALRVQRGTRWLNLSLVPQAVQEGGQWVGKIGVAPRVDVAAMQSRQITIRHAPHIALARAASKTWDSSLLSLKMFWRMVVGDISLKNLSGPVAIADYAGQAARMGVAPFIEFLAWISISLGVLNLLPVPLLDGGHLMYYTAEIIKGSPVSERTMELGQRVGIVLLLSMMLFAFYNDLSRLMLG